MSADLLFSSIDSRPEACFLRVLWAGLERLYAEVRQFEKNEIESEERWKREHGVQYEASFFDQSGDGPNDTAMMNDFIWYASAATCFLGLVGKVLGTGTGCPPGFSHMWKFRDKVAAHTAYVWPWNAPGNPDRHDNPMSRAASIMMNPQWEGDRYWVGRSTFGNDNGEFSHRDWDWCLTQTHEKLEAYVRASLP